jgi:hypothetical protein
MDRFALLELERDDGIRTFLARETAVGRDVQVHLFPHTDPRNAGLLGRLARSPDFVQRQILDRGYNEGIPYVVTLPLAHRMSFREWMTAMDRISASSASLDKQFAGLFERRSEEPLGGRRGQWRVPVPKTVSQAGTPETTTMSTAATMGAATRTTTADPRASAASSAHVPAVAQVPTVHAPIVDAGVSRAARSGVSAPALEYPRLPLMTRDRFGAEPSAVMAGPMAFDPAVTGSLTSLASAIEQTPVQPSPAPSSVPSRQPSSALKSGTKSALALVLGVAAALALLALIAAVWAFRPH